jgi:uncharacterized protein (TIGR02270 family)
VNTSTAPYSAILQQLADNTSFFWVLRQRQRHEPHVLSEHLDELDARLRATLDGLTLYGEAGWQQAQANGEFAQGGEAFCLGYLGFYSQSLAQIQYATEFGLQNDDTFKGLSSSLAWLQAAQVHPWITQFFNSKDRQHKRLALSACRLRNEDPAGYLSALSQRPDCLAEPELLAEMLRCVGHFRRSDCAPLAAAQAQHPDPRCAFWASYALLRLGQRDAATGLKALCDGQFPELEPLHSKALVLAMYHLPPDTARLWIGEWVEAGALRRAIQACGLLGDAQALPWLLSQLHNPLLHRVAAEAIYLIRGEPLPAGEPLALAPDDEDTAEALADENLPWVNIAACQSLITSQPPSALPGGILQRTPSQPLALRYHSMRRWLGLN